MPGDSPAIFPDNSDVSGRQHKYWAVVPAAGAGRRMGTDLPKQYLALGSQTVLEHALDALLGCPELAGIVVVVAADDSRWPQLQARYSEQPVTSTSGGSERCHSVLNGLAALAGFSAADDDWVLVHDAARPCVRVTDIRQLIGTLAGHPHGGLLGVPVADTMKRVNSELQVTGTVERAGLWHALTPQMFRIGLLRQALQSAINDRELVTDEAAAMERAGHAPRMVQGQRDNIKITLPSDLALADFYLRTRQGT